MISFMRHLALQSIGVEPSAGVDTQGAPAYGASSNINARVVREDAVVRMPGGDEVKTIVTIWISAEQSPLPDQQDRVTCADGLVGIVVERVDGRTLQGGTLDHIRLRLREV